MNHIEDIFKYFESLFGSEPKTELDFSTDLELLVAVMLSAQCTDKRVNLVTPTLFSKYRTLQDYADADQVELERIIYSINYFKTKAKHLKLMAKRVLDEFGGVIPNTLEDLIKLSGVGRKTASVFLSEFHKTPAMPVDTHVARVAFRLGWTKSKNPAQIERDLMAILPRDQWTRWHQYMVLFGRYHCTARTKSCTWDSKSKTVLCN